jgi:exonuclease SbcD
MKIIHTSDWHIGKVLCNLDRKEDNDSMVVQLAVLVENEKPDALVIAGDIYDVNTPNTIAQKSLSDYLVKLRNACPEMLIVCISGNHDSASRHEIYQTPWDALGVKMLGKIDAADFSPNIIKVADKGVIVAVPYTNERFLSEEFYSSLEAYVRENVGEELPIIYVGHAAIKDCDYVGHKIQDDRFIGGIECTNIAQLGSLYDYVALGHIHKAQTFGEGRARYSGSPVPVSFDEVRSGYEHTFSMVEIASRGAKPEIKTVDVKPVNVLVNIPAEEFAKWSEVMAELKQFPNDIKAYIRLNVLLGESETLPFNTEEQIRAALKGKQAIWAETNATREESVAKADESAKIKALTMQELQEIEPIDIFKAYAANKNLEFKEDFTNMLSEILKTMEETKNED